jgi:hypothetical protein
MANVKITQLNDASVPLGGTELFEVVQSAGSYKVIAREIAATAINVRTVATGGTGVATLTGVVKGNGTSPFTAGTVALASEVSGTLPVANGGTGAVTLTGIVKGSGTSALTAGTVALASEVAGVLPVANGGTGAATLTGYVKGAGTGVMTASATIPFDDLAGRAFAQPYSTADQTGNISSATAVTFNTDLTGAGISVVASTQITFAVTGAYMLSPSIQFKNTDAADHDATIWFRKNGTNITDSATVINVPKAADGGASVFSLSVFVVVTAGQYVEIMWLPEDVDVTIDALPAGAIAPGIPSIICPVMRIA